MGPRTFNSYHRKPLQETDGNIGREESTRSLVRGWWPLKSFSTNKLVQPEEVQQPRDTRSNNLGHAVAIATSSPVPVNAIVAQLGGGPLRAVHAIQTEPSTILLVEFFNDTDAQVFRNHVLNERSYVYGKLVRLAQLDAEQAEALEAHTSTTFPELSRRTLEIFRPVSLGSRRPELIRSEVNQAYIMRVFNKIGAVLQVRPMIYQRYIAFAIDFASVDSAIEAKRLFDEEATVDRSLRSANPRYNKFAGLHQWSLEFSRDNAERTCFF